MFEYLTPADAPVVAGLEKHELTFAKDQPQYIPLRALVSASPDRRVMSRWTFTPEQRKAVAEGADLYLTLSTFGNPLQPISMLIADRMNADYWREYFNLGNPGHRNSEVIRPDSPQKGEKA